MTVEAPVYSALYCLLQGAGVRIIVRGRSSPVCVVRERNPDGWRLEIDGLRSGLYPSVEPAVLKQGDFTVTLTACGVPSASFSVESTAILAVIPAEDEPAKRRRGCRPWRRPRPASTRGKAPRLRDANKRTCWTSWRLNAMIEPLFNDEGERIGIEDVSGLRLAPSPEEREAYAGACDSLFEALASLATDVLGAEKAADASGASAALETNLGRVLGEHRTMAYDEVRAVARALEQHARTHNRTHAHMDLEESPVIVEGSPEAMIRLRNRGLVNDAGELDVERLLSDIQNAREERQTAAPCEAGGAPLINLILGSSKNQTSALPAGFSTPATEALAAPPGRPPRNPAKAGDLPRKASLPRMDSARIASGVRVLGEADHATIDGRFQRYLDDIEDRVICMSDSDGYTVGAEYSTRFNDTKRVQYQLQRFEYACDQSLRSASSAVFLTLTTDPNLTDAERAQARGDTVAKIRARIARGHLTAGQRSKLEWDAARAEGPDAEIAYLEARLASGSDPARKVSKRLKQLTDERERAPALIAEYEAESTPPRRREQVREDLIRIRRLPSAHDAGGFASMWEANRSFQPAWNRFMSYVAKRNGKVRPQYLVSFEFTESGLLHAHAIIMMDWLATNEEIAREWHRCGQGSVTYIYALRRTKNRRTGRLEWRWKTSKPPDAKSISGGEYLKKYLKKAMMGQSDKFRAKEQARIQSLYWVFNKRYWSCSRALLEGFESDLAPKRRDPDAPARFAFWKVLPAHVAEEGELVDSMVYHRGRPRTAMQTTLDGTPPPAEAVA